jgi:phosphate transport system substrate-binding protein
VDSLSLEDIKRIYSGEATHWREFGGQGRIRAFQRNENSGSQSMLQQLMKGRRIMEARHEDRRLGMGGIIREVADYKNHENAIGFTFRLFADDMVKNEKIKFLKIDGVEPTLENIENGSYPIVTTMYAITRKDGRNPNVRHMVNWMVSSLGRSLVEKSGYIPAI